MAGFQRNFDIEKGVRQGCPLSALLFIIIAEVLALRIKQNKDIHGLQIPDNDVTNDQEIRNCTICR